jgi:outer membrane protein assembly factor BamE (lipoprotein component of BamABCDE complex)
MKKALKKIIASLGIAAIACTITSCHHYKDVKTSSDTVKQKDKPLTVTKEIRQGMSQKDLLFMLGAPHIVTKDKSQRETWIYNKVATNATYSTDEKGFYLVIDIYPHEEELSPGKDDGDSPRKALTLIVKFDTAQNVDTFSYHSANI